MIDVLTTVARPRCFILEDTGVDVSPAEFFGELVYLYDDPRAGLLPDPFNPNYGPTLIQLMEDSEFDPDRDFIVLSGRMHTLAASVAQLYNRWEHLQLLVYSPKAKRYSRRLLVPGEDLQHIDLTKGETHEV